MREFKLKAAQVYRLFIDEVGHHNFGSGNDPNERYLCLVGIIMDLEYAERHFQAKMDAIKLEVFGTRDIVFHRRELIDKSPAPYDRLNDPLVKERFDDLLIDLVQKSKYTVIAVMVDKQKLREQYAKWHYHPYHYCLTAMVERYVWWLEENNSTGDVMAEARDKKQNMKLEAAYKFIHRNGTGFANAKRFVTVAQMQSRLTSGELKTKTKKANVPGLQLADVIANPARRHLLCRIQNIPMQSVFGRKIVKILIEQKYRRARWGQHKIEGYGVKLLP